MGHPLGCSKGVGAMEGDGPDVTLAKLVGADHFEDGAGEIVPGVGPSQPVHAGGGEEAVDVSAETKHGGTRGGVVATNALEHPRTVVQTVARDVKGRLGPRDDFAV